MTAIVDFVIQVYAGAELLGEAPAHQSARTRQRQIAELLAVHPDADRVVLRVNGRQEEVFALRDGKLVAAAR
jgi:hypothetical protein